MSALIRTHYLNWDVTGVPSLVHGSKAFDTLRSAWDASLYQAGPFEEDAPRTSDHLAICEWLFAKYNRDNRPDGRVRRSMSMGDIVQVGTSYYVCAVMGFECLGELQ